MDPRVKPEDDIAAHEDDISALMDVNKALFLFSSFQRKRMLPAAFRVRPQSGASSTTFPSR